MHRFGGNGSPTGRLPRAALGVVVDATDDGEGIDRDRAIALVTDLDEFSEWTVQVDDPEARAESVLDGLVQRGHLYEVDGDLYVTDRSALK